MESTKKFENKIKRLDEIVELMSNKTLPLDQSLSLYEEGNKIISELEKELKDAESKIEKVIKG